MHSLTLFPCLLDVAAAQNSPDLLELMLPGPWAAAWGLCRVRVNTKMNG